MSIVPSSGSNGPYAASSPALTCEPVGRAMGLAIAAFALYSGMDTTIKWLAERYPVWELTLGNAIFGLIPLMIWTLNRGSLSQLTTRRLPLHLARGVCVSINVLAAFTAYSLIPLADAYAVAFSSPIFITLLSIIFLDERAGHRRWTAIMLGFAGVLVMLRPGAGINYLGVVAALIGACAYAASAIIARRLRATETLAATAFYSQLVLIAVAGAATLVIFRMPSLNDLALLAGAGLLYGIGTLCFLNAVRRAPVGIVAPFQYSQMLWGTLAGYLVWNHLPDLWILIGGAVVVASGAYILHRETRAARSAFAAA